MFNQSKSYQRTFRLFALLIFSSLLFSVAFAKDASTKPIFIGVSGPLTGNNAQYGSQWKKGFDLALREINQKGGIKGRKLQYIFEDSQSDPKQAVLIAQKFVSDERIVIELGDFSSPASMAASPIYQRAGLVQFGFTNSHPDFTKSGDYMWSNSPSQTDVAPLHADYVKAVGLKKVVVFYLNTDWGKTTYDLTAKHLKEHGIEIVAKEAYLPDEKDFKSAITRISAANPDGIVLISYYTDAALIVQQLRANGFKQPIVANSSNHSPKFLELGGTALEGVFVSSNFTIDDPRPEVKNFVNTFRIQYKEDPDYFATHAYDTIKVVAATIKLGGANRQRIRESLAKIKNVPSVVYGKVSFDPSTRRVAHPKDARLVIKDGKFVVWNGKSAKKSK